MRKVSLAIFTAAILVFNSCKKKEHTMEHPKSETIIDYPAAYVVNGESNSISVIDLNSNEVKQTISLGEISGGHHSNTSTGISWPHHIYLSPDKTKLLVGVPGMDLSAGHGGGMAGMSGKIAVLDASKGTITKVIDLPVMNHNAAFSPNG